MNEVIFPLRKEPDEDYHSGGRQFGARRSGGQRKHAACDLIAPYGTEILAMADGTVVRGPYYFYSETYALEVEHANGMLVRYGEISRLVPPGIAVGVRVTQGQVIARVGRLHSGSSMLHLEMYAGTADGPLTQEGNAYMRRSDLVDPTHYLDAALLVYETSQQGKEGRVNNQVTNTLNVRSEPSMSAEVLFSLAPGATCRVLEEVVGSPYPPVAQTTWYKVQYGERQGFAAARYIDAETEEQAPPRPEVSVEGQVNDLVTSKLNVRSQPSVSSPVVFELIPGMVFKVLEEVVGDLYDWGRSDWCRIEHNGLQGFAAAYYIDISNEPNPLNRWDQALPDVPTTGASEVTAAQDSLSPGIQASHSMAETDLTRVKAIADRFCTAAAKLSVPAAVLAAIASRESRCGNVLIGGWGDNHRAFGIMQVDMRYHQPVGLDDPASLEHIEQAAGIFVKYLAEVQNMHSNWEDPFILKGAAVAYNSGPGNVQTKEGMDIGTTGNDYGSDVMARAQFYASHSQLSVFRADS
jgi:uncharacterized protein YraI